MNSTFSASEAIDLLIRLGCSFNGVAKWAEGAWRLGWEVASSCVILLCCEGWVTFGQGKTPGEVEETGEGSRSGGTQVNPEVCNTNELFSLAGEQLPPPFFLPSFLPALPRTWPCMGYMQHLSIGVSMNAKRWALTPSHMDSDVAPLECLNSEEGKPG